MIKNLKVFLEDKDLKKKFALITASVIVGLSFTACSADLTNNNVDDSKYEKLDRTKIEFSLDDYEVEKYYDSHVMDIMSDMSEEEKDDYYVDVNLQYIGKEIDPTDEVLFLRSDDLLIGNVKLDDNYIQIYPGLYKIVTNAGSLGELEALTPGKEIDLTVNFEDKSFQYTEKDKNEDAKIKKSEIDKKGIKSHNM